jgi:hypothetical protein
MWWHWGKKSDRHYTVTFGLIFEPNEANYFRELNPMANFSKLLE